MKIEVNEHGTIVLKEVFNPIKLQTPNRETLIITMRDSGYEICYENEFYELKQGNTISTVNKEVPMRIESDDFLGEYNVTGCCGGGPVTRENYCPNCGKKIKKAP
jgi:hypothetical protein